MKNKNTIIWILAIISTISTTALITLWLIRPAAPEMRPFHHKSDSDCSKTKQCDNRMVEKLNMNPEQAEKYMAQRKTHHEKVDPVFDSLRSLRTKLFEEMDKSTPDSAVINSCIANISKQEAIVQREGVNHILYMKSFLDPVQFDSLMSIHSHAMMPMGKAMHKDKRPHCK